MRLNAQVLAAGSSSDDPARLHLFLLSEFCCNNANSWFILNPLAHSNQTTSLLFDIIWAVGCSIGLELPAPALTRMGIGSESAGALKGSAPYQSPAVLVEKGNRQGTLWLCRIVRALRLT